MTKGYLQKTEKAVNQSIGLTKQLLTFAKGGAPFKKLYSITDLLTETTEFCLAGSNIRAEFQINDPWLVEIDADQMSQVIQNIIINAKQAMPEGGKVLISTENVTGENGMKHLRISIKDTGIGIPENHLVKIFDPYFTTKQTGSGLGLSVCYSVVQKHGGRIFVESKIGIGTIFHIMLPATDKVTTEPTGASMSEMPARKGKILIMDDDEMLRDVLTNMLQLNGHSISSSWEGNEAISLYVHAMQVGEPFDLVIMDLTIPDGMGGKETIQEILAINPKAKVVVSSGYSDDPIMSDPLKYGFVAAISKPYQIKDLTKIVSSVLKN